MGDGDEKEKLEKQFPNINFVGWKNKDEVKDYMKGSRALIFPSRWYETAGLTVLEAQAIGIPCIVSSNTASEEFVYNKELVFNQNDLFDLKEKIIKLSNNDYDFYKNNNRTFSEKEYVNNLIIEYEVIK